METHILRLTVEEWLWKKETEINKWRKRRKERKKNAKKKKQKKKSIRNSRKKEMRQYDYISRYHCHNFQIQVILFWRSKYPWWSNALIDIIKSIAYIRYCDYSRTYKPNRHTHTHTPHTAENESEFSITYTRWVK